MQTLVVRELGPWQSSWDTLAASAPLASPFMRSWWLDAVVDDDGRFVLVTDDGELVGGVPLELRRRVAGVDVYRCAGSGVLCPDHLDVLASPGRTSEVAEALNAWFRSPGARVLDLQGVVEGSALSSVFAPVRCQALDVAPWEPLPDGEERYLSSRSANFRRDVRRTLRRLEASGARHRRVGTGELEPAMRDFALLQAGRPGRAPLLAELPRLTAALRTGIERGEAQVHVLEAASRTIAMSISFITAGRLSLYQNARSLDVSVRGVGNALHMLVIEEAIADGCHEVDLLRGSEPYKSAFASHQRFLVGVRAAHGRRGRATLAIWTAADRLRTIAGRARRRLVQRAEGVGGRKRRLAPE